MTNAPVMRIFFFAVVALLALLLRVHADAQVCPCFLEDATPPVLQLPPNQTREATGPGGVVVTFSVSASDNVDDDVWVRCSPESWSTFVLGTTTVSCTATDHMKNTAAGSFTVTVVPVSDTTPPVLTLPIVPTVKTTRPEGAVVSFSGSAHDTVSGNVPVVFKPASGSTFPVGTTTVAATATDAAGNTITKSFTVTVVVGTAAPVFTSLTASPNILWPPYHQMVSVQITAKVTDDDSPAPVTRIIGVASNEAQTGLGTGDIGPDWSITGALTVRLRAERASKGSGRVYTVTVESRDASGNASLRAVTVKVPLQR